MLRIEETVNELREQNRMGRCVKREFNGIILCSEGFNVDNIFKTVTKETRDKFYLKVNEWTKRGMEHIYKENEELWAQFVQTYADSKSFGIEVRATLAVLVSIDMDIDPKFKRTKELLAGISKESGHYDFIRRSVLFLSPKGPEFFLASKEAEITDEDLNLVKRTISQNLTYEANKLKKAKSK